MNWADERYVRWYTRDTAEWLALSFTAQGLFGLLLRKVDRTGVLPLGRLGRRAVAVVVGHPGDWPRLEPALDELLADGCVEIRGDVLVVPNFIPAQEATMSGALRTRQWREKVRDRTKAPGTQGDAASPCGDDASLGVTRGDKARRGVTPNLAVPNRTEPSEPTTAAAAARERAREAEPKAAPTETLPGTAEPGSDGGRAPSEVPDPGPPAPGHSAEAGTSSAAAAAPPDAAPPRRRLVVVDEVEFGPAGARVRAAVEQELGVALAVGGPEVHDRFEARIVAQGGPEAVLSWMLPTLVQRRRSGGPTPGSVAYLDTMLSDRPEAPPVMEPGPWELVVAYAREAFGSTSAQLVAALSRLTARFDGDDLVIEGPSAAMYGDRHGEDLARLVERALGRPVALRFEAQAAGAGGGP